VGEFSHISGAKRGNHCDEILHRCWGPKVITHANFDDQFRVFFEERGSNIPLFH